MPTITAQNISKSFDGILAIDDLNLTCKSGEIHVLLGENGAGKSTLACIFAGLYQADSGNILFDGKAVRIASPNDSLRLGIGMVFQHPLLVPELTVIENMLLGEMWWQRRQYAKTLSRFEELATLLGVHINPQSPLKDISLGERQHIEIIRALWYGQDILIFDEPTSLLSPQGVEILGTMMQTLAKQGKTLLFITHKLHEALTYADHISILRKGKNVGSIAKHELQSLPKDELIQKIYTYMFENREPNESPALSSIIPTASNNTQSKKNTFCVHDITSLSEVNTCNIKSISFSLCSGEIFGIAGIDGNGQKHLAELLAGQRPVASGRILLHDTDITTLLAAKRQKVGVYYVTDDRLGEGIATTENIATNMLLKKVGDNPFWKYGFAQKNPIHAFAKEKIQNFAISPHDHHAGTSKLSGGNIQKVILARELENKDAALIIFNKPTHGLDMYTTLQVRTLLKAQAKQGLMLIIISSDLDELLELCTRIAVLSKGRIAGIVENAKGARTTITHMMTAS